MRVRPATYLAFALVCAALITAAVPALAQEEDPARTHVADVNGYDVDFTLPTAAKAGCLVCHGDANLIRLRDDELFSYYVDPFELEAGPHAGVQCAGCHLDFAFSAPHEQSSEDWESVSRSACKNCHQDEARDYTQGAHRPVVNGDSVLAEPAEPVDPDAPAPPLCGDCHGGHDIVALEDNPEGRALLHANGWDVCGRCHEEYWDNYNDYYHGSAYRRGAAAAPACWDCHGYHEIFPSSDRRSGVHPNRLEVTCGECHPGDVNERYLEYAEIIHGKSALLDANPLYTLIQRVRSAISGVFDR